jgi:hypothetical protein
MFPKLKLFILSKINDYNLEKWSLNRDNRRWLMNYCLGFFSKIKQVSQNCFDYLFNLMVVSSSTPHKHAPNKQKSAPVLHASAAPSAKPLVTKIIASFDVGWGNALYIRGEGAGLSWDKGILMDNLAVDHWEWKTVVAQEHLTFKLLMNDRVWQTGDNLEVKAGETLIIIPHF